MLMAAALNPNTQRTYTSAQNRYINFCSAFNLPVMPATEDNLLLYIAHLFDAGLKGSSIRVYLSAVRSLHVFAGYSYPTEMLRVRLALKGAVTKSAPVVRKFPITFDVLSKILKFVQKRFDSKLMSTMMAVAFFGCLRASEICVCDAVSFCSSDHLCVEDVHVDRKKKILTIFLKKSKTDTYNSGTTIRIGFLETNVCAYCYALKYIDSKSKGLSGKLPFFVNSLGDAVKKNYFVSVTRLALGMGGFDPSKFSGHSFRAGAATTAGNNNFEEYELKMLGRWASSAYNVYLRNPLLVTTFASRLAKP
jgi:site-specific recombinase XerD